MSQPSKWMLYLYPRFIVDEKHTTKSFLISEYTRLANELKLDPTKYRFQSPAESCIINYCPVGLHSLNRVSLTHLTKAPNKFFRGKYFVCRTITASIKLCCQLTVVEVPGEDMKHRGAFLCLYHYLHPQDEDEGNSLSILNEGTILLIKNPILFKSIENIYGVRCDNPSDVAVISDKQFKLCFTELKWPSTKVYNEENILFPFLKKSWCRRSKDWKSVGHYRLERKNYTGAFQAYSAAIRHNRSDLEALDHRCSLNLRLKNYRIAFEDSEDILKIDPFNFEAICHQVNSLFGLSRFSDAIDFLQRYIWMDCPSSKVTRVDKTTLSELVSKAKTLRTQKIYGTFDLVKILNSPSRFIHDCADHIGNIVKKEIEGKGTGMVAAVSIRCGELLVATKAFEMAFPDDLDDFQNSTFDIGSGVFHSPAQIKLFTSIAHRLIWNPELGKEFYKLYDGTRRTATKYCQDENENRFLNMKRIYTICAYNCFSTKLKPKKENRKRDSACGLWLSASYFNHSCYDANSRWSVYGNVLFIRACKNIKQGEEITIPYIPCTKSYSERVRLLSAYDFVCDCSLCSLDAKDPETTHIRRKEILANIDDLLKVTKPHCKEIATLIEELLQLREDERKLNVYALYPMMNLARIYMREKNFSLAAEILQSVHNITFKTILTGVSLRCCVDGIRCYLRCNKIKEAELLIIDLKFNLIQDYGMDSKEILNYAVKNFSDTLTENGIEF